MENTERALEKSSAEEYQAAVSVCVADVMNVMDTIETREVAEKELERALWDLVATYTEILMRAQAAALGGIEDRSEHSEASDVSA